MSEEKEVIQDENLEEKDQPKKRIKRLPVRIIRTDNKIQLIEFVGENELIRKLVETGTVKSGKIGEDIFNAAPDYGIPWNEFNSDCVDSQQVHDNLHKQGIWTFEDLRLNLQLASRILIAAGGKPQTRNDFVAFAKKFNKEA